MQIKGATRRRLLRFPKVLQRHDGSAFGFTFFGGLHQSEDLQRFAGLDRDLAGLEELGDLGGQRFVADVFVVRRDNSHDRDAVAVDASRRNSFVAEDRRAVFDRSLFDASVRSDAAVFPSGGDGFGGWRRSTRH